VELSERHVGRLLHQRGFTRLSARPRHPKTDEGAQEAFKKTSPTRSPRCSRPAPGASASRSGSRMRRGSARKGP
jgi:hypothetical protein